jgi:hemolysin activation/secretion protein/AraC-like DNA-binding protein
MTVERHLILQEMILRPSGEWAPQCVGWTIARVTEGAGYWMHGGKVRELNVGDGFVAGFKPKAVLRASQLGLLKLKFFTVHPQYLNGLLTMAELHQFESAARDPVSDVFFFGANEAIGQKFTRLVGQTPSDGLPMRCALLQLWSGAISSLMIPAATDDNKLRERFRQLVGQIPEAKLSECSLAELAAQLHCSERHFSRLFRKEFGVSPHARQIELRFQRACQLLADPGVKIINVAYGSGYRHLGLFNATFKKRFGMTPREWRQQNLQKDNPARPRNPSSRVAALAGIVLMMFGLLFASSASAQTNQTDSTSVHIVAVSTNGPHFTVDKYLVMGNSILSPDAIGGIFTNVPAAFGTNVTFDAIRAALGDLQMAYRERGFATVSVGLPQQKLTNAAVKVQVTEGRLAAINVTGNRWFSTDNVLRALPGLHTNMLLNSHIFQRELDTANASRDRQIYPVIGPGLEPGTTELTLKVKDQFPLHARIEVNNQATPGTPDMRVNGSIQYDNLWDREHQIGLQYSFDLEKFRGNDLHSTTPLDSPLIANYSGYYRIPLGHYDSVQKQVDANPGKFGYNIVTHRFDLPPATGRPELTFYASRSISDTDVKRGPRNFLVDTTATNSSGTIYHPLSISTNSAGQNITLSENLGLKFSLPLPPIKNISTTLSFGADFKRYRQTGFNTNENFFETQFFDQQGQLHVDDVPAPQPEPTTTSSLDYFPLNVGLSGSIPDKFGMTYFNATANFNVLPIFSDDRAFSKAAFFGAAYTTKVNAHYVSLLLGADRVQTIYKDWSVKLHADGQWADGPLISNEQFGMGGVSGVRGYTDGEAYGDTGWRVSIEPQTPLINIGMVDGDKPFWVRSSVFMDYGEIYLSEKPAPGARDRGQFFGVGWSITANIGSHFDARLTIACPLLSDFFTFNGTRAGDVHIYFGVGMQF